MSRSAQTALEAVTPAERRALAVRAEHVMAAHDPAQQLHSYERRCALCGFTRSPCEPYELAEALAALLDAVDRRA